MFNLTVKGGHSESHTGWDASTVVTAQRPRSITGATPEEHLVPLQGARSDAAPRGRVAT